MEIPRGGLVHAGWGEIGLISRSMKASPDWPVQMSLTWYSLVDDRFYGGRFALPNMAVEAQAGLPQPQGPSSCDTLLAGMAPGGRAAIWLCGGGLARQLLRMQADERVIEVYLGR